MSEGDTAICSGKRKRERVGGAAVGCGEEEEEEEEEGEGEEDPPAAKASRYSETETEGQSTIVRKKVEQKEEEGEEERDSQHCLVFIVEKKISSGHLSHLKDIAKRKNFAMTTSFSDSPTHIVSPLPSYERTITALPSQPPPQAEVVTLESSRRGFIRKPQWEAGGLTTSFMEGKPVQVTDRYRLKPAAVKERLESDPTSKELVSSIHFELPEYECQRSTPLTHHNHTLTDALELLERYYQHLDYKQGDTRALAFRQASCVLKALPKKVDHIDEVSCLHRIGKHSCRVIEEILSRGVSAEVEECKNNEWFQCVELFTSVYGCGTATACRWYQRGLRTIEEVRQCKELDLTDTQRLGLKYYDHLCVPIPRHETEFVTAYIESQVKACLKTPHFSSFQARICFPETSVQAVGGYRRGKPFSHDCDLLLTHPDCEVTDVLLETLLDKLQNEGVLLHADTQIGHNNVARVQHSHINTSKHSFTPEGRQRRVKFDYLDKAFCILQLDSNRLGGEKDDERERREGLGRSNSETPLIRRVDLIVSPHDQYPFALVSWTGSKQFNRSIRRYAPKECSKSISAHGIFDTVEGKFVAAKTEQEVFDILKLKYLEPCERNC